MSNQFTVIPAHALQNKYGHNPYESSEELMKTQNGIDYLFICKNKLF